MVFFTLSYANDFYQTGSNVKAYDVGGSQVARLHQHQSKHRAGTRMCFWRELLTQTRQVQDFQGQFQGIFVSGFILHETAL